MCVSVAESVAVEVARKMLLPVGLRVRVSDEYNPLDAFQPSTPQPPNYLSDLAAEWVAQWYCYIRVNYMYLSRA